MFVERRRARVVRAAQSNNFAVRMDLRPLVSHANNFWCIEISINTYFYIILI